MRRLIGWTAALAMAAGAAAPGLEAAPAPAPAAVERPAAADAGLPGDWSVLAPGAAAGAGVGAEGVQIAKKKGGGGGGGRKLGGAGVRRGDGARYTRRGDYRSNNTVIVNRGRPGYRHRGPVYYRDDDDDGVAGALVGGIIGLGIGAAIASTGSPSNTCVDNDGDGVCDAY